VVVRWTAVRSTTEELGSRVKCQGKQTGNDTEADLQSVTHRRPVRRLLGTLSGLEAGVTGVRYLFDCGLFSSYSKVLGLLVKPVAR